MLGASILPATISMVRPQALAMKTTTYEASTCSSDPAGEERSLFVGMLEVLIVFQSSIANWQV